MATRPIKAGSAYVEIYADDTKFKRSMRGMKGRLSEFSKSLGGAKIPLLALGAAAVAATKHFIDLGDQLDKMSKRTGVAANSLKQLGFAAELSGSNLETVEKGFAGMSRFMLQAERGLSTSTDVLEMMNVQLRDVLGKEGIEQFRILGNAIGAIDDPTKKSGLALAVFGRAGRELIPMFDDLESSLREFSRLNLGIDDEDIENAAALKDAFFKLGEVVKTLAFNFGSELAPSIELATEGLTNFITGVQKLKALGLPITAAFGAGRQAGRAFTRADPDFQMGPFLTKALADQARAKYKGFGYSSGAGFGDVPAPFGGGFAGAGAFASPDLSAARNLIGRGAAANFGGTLRGIGATAAGLAGAPVTGSQKGVHAFFAELGKLGAAGSNKAAAGIQTLVEDLPDMADSITSTAGTFSALAVGGLAPGKGIDAVADNTRTLIGKQEETITAIEDNAPQFA